MRHDELESARAKVWAELQEFRARRTRDWQCRGDVESKNEHGNALERRRERRVRGRRHAHRTDHIRSGANPGLLGPHRAILRERKMEMEMAAVSELEVEADAGVSRQAEVPQGHEYDGDLERNSEEGVLDAEETESDLTLDEDEDELGDGVENPPLQAYRHLTALDGLLKVGYNHIRLDQSSPLSVV